jgi:cytochrome c oxidase assembly protein subunit 15
MASLGGSVPMFRSLAPRFSKEFFTCRQCLGRNQDYATKSTFRKQLAGLSFGRKSHNANLNTIGVTATKFFSPTLRRSVSGSAVAGALENGASKAKSSFPKVSDKIVAYWLLGSAASVFGIVVFGGLTRLTESGYVLLMHRDLSDTC